MSRCRYDCVEFFEGEDVDNVVGFVARDVVGLVVEGDRVWTVVSVGTAVGDKVGLVESDEVGIVVTDGLWLEESDGE